MTENDYVATATAEKRLREVLAARFGRDINSDELADVLLSDAEITYLPRKRTVSILLRYPETAAATPTVDANGETKEQREDGFTWADKEAYDESQLAKAYDNQPAVRDPKAPARFGEFQPTVTSAPEYHEDDYFTE